MKAENVKNIGTEPLYDELQNLAYEGAPIPIKNLILGPEVSPEIWGLDGTFAMATDDVHSIFIEAASSMLPFLHKFMCKHELTSGALCKAPTNESHFCTAHLPLLSEQQKKINDYLSNIEKETKLIRIGFGLFIRTLQKEPAQPLYAVPIVAHAHRAAILQGHAMSKLLKRLQKFYEKVKEDKEDEGLAELLDFGVGHSTKGWDFALKKVLNFLALNRFSPKDEWALAAPYIMALTMRQGVINIEYVDQHVENVNQILRTQYKAPAMNPLRRAGTPSLHDQPTYPSYHNMIIDTRVSVDFERPTEFRPFQGYNGIPLDPISPGNFMSFLTTNK